MYNIADYDIPTQAEIKKMMETNNKKREVKRAKMSQKEWEGMTSERVAY